MANMHMEFIDVRSSRAFQIGPLKGSIPVGNIARYLSENDAFIDANTLEIGYRINPTQALRQMNIQIGDRILLLRDVPTPRPLDLYKQVIRFKAQEFNEIVPVPSNNEIIIGRLSENYVPDLDITPIMPAQYRSGVSRSSLVLRKVNDAWYIQSTGEPRAFVGEFLLERDGEFLPIDYDTDVLFHANEGGGQLSDPIAKLNIVIGEGQAARSLTPEDKGNVPVKVMVGIEKRPIILEISDSLSLGMIMQHISSIDVSKYSLYLMRLVPPSKTLTELQAMSSGDVVWYISAQYLGRRNTLVFRDLRDRSNKYEIIGKSEMKPQRVGFTNSKSGSQVDIDLMKSVKSTSPQYIQRLQQLVSPTQSNVKYNMDNNSWILEVAENSEIPIFHNNSRVTSQVELNPEDVITFGTSLSDYVVRLSVQIKSEAVEIDQSN